MVKYRVKTLHVPYLASLVKPWVGIVIKDQPTSKRRHLNSDDVRRNLVKYPA